MSLCLDVESSNLCNYKDRLWHVVTRITDIYCIYLIYISRLNGFAFQFINHIIFWIIFDFANF